MFNYSKVFFVSLFFLLAYLFSPTIHEASAQVCSGPCAMAPGGACSAGYTQTPDSSCNTPPNNTGVRCCPASPPPPTCGNGSCSGGETCSSCPADCGSCPPGPPGPPPGPPPPPPGWGGCGSCSPCGGPNAECVTDPLGACLWDPGSCNSGNPPPPPPQCSISMTGIPPTVNVGSVYSVAATMSGVGGAGNLGDFRFRVTNTNPTPQPFSINPAAYPTGFFRNVDQSTGGFTCYANGNCLASSNARAINPGTARLTVTGRVKPCPACNNPATWAVCSTVRTITVTGPVTPFATIDVVPNPVNLPSGQTGTIIANVTTSNGGVVQDVSFVSSNVSTCTATSPDTTAPYTSTVTAVAPGTTTITATVTLTTGETFSDTTIVNVTAPGPWWQISGGNVTSGGAAGTLVSQIPDSCVLPGCTPSFIIDSTYNNAGTAMYGGFPSSYDFSQNTTNQGSVSTNGWLANSQHAAPVYNFAYAKNLITGKVTLNNYAGNFNGAASGGYEWYESAGDVTLNNTTIGGSKRVVLFVNGDLNIDGRINLAQPDTSFFLSIVSGDINIDPSVSDVGINPGVEGLYLCNGSFNTGAGDSQLTINGAIVAHGGVNLSRDLQAGNTTDPAETFVHDPRQLLNFPPQLSRDTVIWREVAP